MAAKNEKEIIRAVFLNGETYVPGQEDELEQAFKDHAAKEKDEDREYDHKKNIERLTKQGSIVGFGATVDEEDMEETDLDRTATRRKNPHLLESKKPLARGGKAPPTMEEVQLQPDSNVVEEKLSGRKAGGKKAAADNADKVEKATAEAAEERAEASIQQESEQVPPPEKPSKSKKSE